MDDITEMIADAKAEEEVKNAQINRRIASASPAMVTITLEEYCGLRDAYRDLSILTDALMDDIIIKDGKTEYEDEWQKGRELIAILKRLYPNAREW